MKRDAVTRREFVAGLGALGIVSRRDLVRGNTPRAVIGTVSVPTTSAEIPVQTPDASGDVVARVKDFPAGWQFNAGDQVALVMENDGTRAARPLVSNSVGKVHLLDGEQVSIGGTVGRISHDKVRAQIRRLVPDSAVSDISVFGMFIENVRGEGATLFGIASAAEVLPGTSP